MATHVKVCRDCGEEYRLDAVDCADCGGELETRELDESGAVLETEGAEQAALAPAVEPADHRVVFVTPRAADLVPLADALREGGIRYWLAEQPARTEGALPRYALLVTDGDAGAALRTLAPLVAPEEEPEAVQGIEARFEPDRGYLQCPACGAEQAPGAVECTSCGLGLGADDAEATPCPRCGAPLPDPDATCPACGSSRVG